MSKRSTTTLVAVLGVLLSSLIAASPADAAAAAKPKRDQYFAGHAAGTIIQVLDKTVRNDLLGFAVVGGKDAPASDFNNVNSTKALNGLIKVGAVNTWTKARRISNGVRQKSRARTADLNLLNGLIKADAVETTTWAQRKLSGKKSANAKTRFIGLEIAGRKIPINVPRNTSINIPGVATVLLNATTQWTQSGGQFVQSYALYAQLLKPMRQLPAGATIILNVVNSMVTPGPPPNARAVFGAAHGTFINAKVGPALSLEAARTGAMLTPPGGTGGKPVQNTSVDIGLPGVLSVNTVKSVTTATAKKAFSRVKMTNSIAGLSLFDNLIRADAIKVTSITHRGRNAKKAKTTHKMKFVDLVIAGRRIPINVSPNTVINVANLGKVSINKRVKDPNGGYIMGLLVELSTKRAGLPIGAVIEISVASTSVG